MTYISNFSLKNTDMRILLPLLMIVLAFSACQVKVKDQQTDESSSETKLPALMERKGELAKAVEWPRTKEKVAELQQKIYADPNNLKARLQLATIFISEARITGEHPYYYPAIDQMLDKVLSIDSRNYEANVLKASVKMSQHKFSEALALAEKAKTINPNDAYVYGILVDVNVELGDYEKAVAHSDKMQAMKPSLESYSRASYLREIFGDQNGAIEAMKLAAQAGLPGSEPQCWSINTLGELYLNAGEPEKAEQEFKKVLALRPSYAFATAGLAKVEMHRQNYDKALELLASATEVMPEYSFYEQQADIYVLQGKNEAAQKLYAEVEGMLREDEESGHLVDLELAKLYVKMNKPDEAKKYAMKEYTIRPNNIDVNNELAWIAYMQQDLKKSKDMMKVAKRTGNKHPELVKRASVIDRS